MKILLQTNNRKESQLAHEFKKLTESGFEVIPFGYTNSVKPCPINTFGFPTKYLNITGLESITKEDKIITRACIPLVKQLKCYKLANNLTEVPLFNETIQYNLHNFDVRNIPNSDLFLNKKKDHWDVTAILNILDRTYSHPIFVKPLNDLKLFSGCLIQTGKTLREVLIEKNEFTNITDYLELVLISNNCPRIIEEVRCYVVNRKVVTLSRYRYNNEYNVTPLPDLFKQQYMMFAQRVIDTVYCPCDNFTIDICEIGNYTLKVIEYNCLTTSSLYEADTKQLFTALKEYYYD